MNQDAGYVARLAYNIQWRRRRIEGLCLHCPNPRDPSNSRNLCPACFDRERLRIRESARHLRERRLAEGLCVSCGKNPIHADYSRQCRPCAERANYLKCRKLGYTPGGRS